MQPRTAGGFGAECRAGAMKLKCLDALSGRVLVDHGANDVARTVAGRHAAGGSQLAHSRGLIPLPCPHTGRLVAQDAFDIGADAAFVGHADAAMHLDRLLGNAGAAKARAVPGGRPNWLRVLT